LNYDTYYIILRFCSFVVVNHSSGAWHAAAGVSPSVCQLAGLRKTFSSHFQ